MGNYADASLEARHTFQTEALPRMESVRRFARSLCHDAADADDLVQETYLRAYQSWHTFRVGTDCRRWLFTICRNVFRRQLRVATDTASLHTLMASVGPRATAPAPHIDAADSCGTQDDLITRLDLAAALDTALPLVPEPYRSTLVMVLLRDQTYEAAAEQLGIPVGTVRSRLFRARRLVQADLMAVARDAGVLGQQEWTTHRRTAAKITNKRYQAGRND